MPIRLLNVEDIPAVLAVQRECYMDQLLESERTFHLKIDKCSRGCLGLDRNGRIGGYVFCQPWRSGEAMPLDDASAALPEACDCLYIHDLSVIPAWRGTGAAKELLDGVFGLAEDLGLRKFALVSVQSSERFWARWGFQVVRGFEYAPGVAAFYMTREVPG